MVVRQDFHAELVKLYKVVLFGQTTPMEWTLNSGKMIYAAFFISDFCGNAASSLRL
jgi:hypothetical protein